MQDIEVYPFNLEKKLYHVKDDTGGNGLVMASFGGEKVLSSWTDKKDNEVYKLDGTNEIIKVKVILYTNSATIGGTIYWQHTDNSDSPCGGVSEYAYLDNSSTYYAVFSSSYECYLIGVSQDHPTAIINNHVETAKSKILSYIDNINHTEPVLSEIRYYTYARDGTEYLNSISIKLTYKY